MDSLFLLLNLATKGSQVWNVNELLQVIELEMYIQSYLLLNAHEQ